VWLPKKPTFEYHSLIAGAYSLIDPKEQTKTTDLKVVET
jgi:hypothetical protein